MQPEIASPSLPTEIWTQIIQGLPAHYQRSCLSISKLFHDIALQFVFASVTVRLGNVRDFYLADEDRWCNWNNLEKADADAAIARSYELLQHIARSPSGFAPVVKQVSVRAYAFPGHDPPVEFLDALEEALSVLRLRAFAWYGCHPIPRPQVLQVLSTTSHETMEVLLLPAEPMDYTPVLAIGRLKSLSFLNRYGDRYQPLEKKDARIARMAQTITGAAASSSSLRSLGIFDKVLKKLTVQHLTTLVDLTLTLVGRVDPLKTVFTHCAQLRSLTLLAGLAHQDALTALLHAHASALPRLTSLQLFYQPVSSAVVSAVAAFLLPKLQLERLDLGYHWDESRYGNIEPVLRVLPMLPRLRVLGLELSDSAISELGLAEGARMPDVLLRLGECVPPGLTALSLWVTAQFQTPEMAMAEDVEDAWVHFFRGLRDCRFVHVSINTFYSERDELRRALFEHPPPRAELVGVHEDLRWVERDPQTGEQVGYSESWPLSRVYNRTVDDFRCEEWEWLMRQVDLRIL